MRRVLDDDHVNDTEKDASPRKGILHFCLKKARELTFITRGIVFSSVLTVYSFASISMK